MPTILIVGFRVQLHQALKKSPFCCLQIIGTGITSHAQWPWKLIRYLHLTYCAFRPMVGFDCLRRLTKLHLYQVRLTGNELGCLISKSFALEQLELMSCDELICLKIPLCLERLSCLRVTWCKMLKVIESMAPNLSSFDLFGDSIQLSLGESSQLKNLHVGFSYHDNFVSYSITRLPSIVPHLETLTISSTGEVK